MRVPFGSFQKEVASGYDHVLQMMVCVVPSGARSLFGVQDVFCGDAETEIFKVT